MILFLEIIYYGVAIVMGVCGLWSLWQSLGP